MNLYNDLVGKATLIYQTFSYGNAKSLAIKTHNLIKQHPGLFFFATMMVGKNIRDVYVKGSLDLRYCTIAMITLLKMIDFFQLELRIPVETYFKKSDPLNIGIDSSEAIIKKALQRAVSTLKTIKLKDQSAYDRLIAKYSRVSTLYDVNKDKYEGTTDLFNINFILHLLKGGTCLGQSQSLTKIFKRDHSAVFSKVLKNHLEDIFYAQILENMKNYFLINPNKPTFCSKNKKDRIAVSKLHDWSFNDYRFIRSACISRHKLSSVEAWEKLYESARKFLAPSTAISGALHAYGKKIGHSIWYAILGNNCYLYDINLGGFGYTQKQDFFLFLKSHLEKNYPKLNLVQFICCEIHK